LNTLVKYNWILALLTVLKECWFNWWKYFCTKFW